MSTRSLIAKKMKDGTFRVIYCHHDGYPSHHGPILLHYYRDPRKINNLIKHGDLSSLGKEIGRKHDFNMVFNLTGMVIKATGDEAAEKRAREALAAFRDKGWCRFYGRDRGEKHVSATKHKNLEAVLKYFQSDDTWADYLYVFQNGIWWYTGLAGNRDKPLKLDVLSRKAWEDK